MAAAQACRDDRVLRATRALSAFIAPFLIVAFVVLYGFPARHRTAVRVDDPPHHDPDGARLGLPRGVLLLRPGAVGVALGDPAARVVVRGAVRHPPRRGHDHPLGPVQPPALRLLAVGRPLLHRAVPGRRSPTSPTVATRPRPARTRRRLGRVSRWVVGLVGLAALATGITMFVAPAADDRDLAVDADPADLPGRRRDLLPGRRGHRRAGRPSLGDDPADAAGGGADDRARCWSPRSGRPAEFATDRPLTWLMLVGFVGVLVGSAYLWYARRSRPRRTASATRD